MKYKKPEMIVFKNDEIQDIIEANASSACQCYTKCYFSCGSYNANPY